MSAAVFAPGDERLVEVEDVGPERAERLERAADDRLARGDRCDRPVRREAAASARGS